MMEKAMKILRVYKSIEYDVPCNKNNYDILFEFESYIKSNQNDVDLTVEVKNKGNMSGCASIGFDNKVNVYVQSDRTGKIGDSVISKSVFNSDYIITRIFTEESRDGGF